MKCNILHLFELLKAVLSNLKVIQQKYDKELFLIILFQIAPLYQYFRRFFFKHSF
jgi:hypothetical protein